MIPGFIEVHVHHDCGAFGAKLDSRLLVNLDYLAAVFEHEDDPAGAASLVLTPQAFTQRVQESVHEVYALIEAALLGYEA